MIVQLTKKLKFKKKKSEFLTSYFERAYQDHIPNGLGEVVNYVLHVHRFFAILLQ